MKKNSVICHGQSCETTVSDYHYGPQRSYNSTNSNTSHKLHNQQVEVPRFKQKKKKKTALNTSRKIKQIQNPEFFKMAGYKKYRCIYIINAIGNYLVI